MPALLEVTGLSRRFGGLQAVRDLSLAMGPDEVLGLIGPNGAGKTTAFNLLSGFLAPDTAGFHTLAANAEWIQATILRQ